MIVCEPGRTFDYVLKSDRNKEVKPTFHVKALTVRETRDLIAKADEASIVDYNSMVDAYLSIVREYVLSIDNAPNGCTLETIEDYISGQELREIVSACVMQRPSEDDIKN